MNTAKPLAGGKTGKMYGSLRVKLKTEKTHHSTILDSAIRMCLGCGSQTGTTGDVARLDNYTSSKGLHSSM